MAILNDQPDMTVVAEVDNGQQGVDKRSIHQVFSALQLLLEIGDYAHASLCSEEAIINLSKG